MSHGFTRVVLCIFIVQCVVLCATALLFVSFGGSLAHEISNQDAREYMLLADSLLEDKQLHLPGLTVPETWRTPGYPAFIATIFALTNSSLAILLVVLAFIGAVTSGCIYLIGKELGLPERPATIAGMLFGFSTAVIWIPPSGMGGDIVFAFLMTVALYLLLRASSWYWLVAVGISLGIATLVRPLGLYLSLLLIIAAPFLVPRFTHGAKVVALIFATFMLAITPWMARNYSVAGHFALSSQFAFNPFYYNIPLFYAWQRGTSEEVERTKLTDTVGTRDVYALVNGFTYYDELSSIDRRFLRENLIPYTLFHIYKTIPFFIGSGINVIYATITNEIPEMPDVPFFPRAGENTATLFYAGNLLATAQNLAYYWPSTLERLVWLMLFIFAFIAPFITNGRQRRFAIFSIIMIVAIAILSSPIAQPRYRIPAEPFIWLCSILTIYSLAIRKTDLLLARKPLGPGY